MEKTDSLTEIAYRAIQNELFTARIVPGDRVSEQSLAAQLGIGRTPVREAIRQFQTEGLMESVTRLGTFLKKPIRTDFVEIFEMREALESFAAYSAAKKLDDRVLELEPLCAGLKLLQDDLVGIDTAVDPAEKLKKSEFLFDKYWSLDMKFHELIAKIAGNRQLEKEIETVRTREKIYTRGYVPLNSKFPSQTYSIHLWILRAIKNREPENARIWAVKHIRQESKSILEMIDETLKTNGGIEYTRKIEIVNE